MMKVILKALLCASAPVSVYLFGAFVAWDFNAGVWSIEWRLFVGLLGALGGAAMAIEQFFIKT
jgi:hypothetical protein